ncbi:DUF4858 domain-containing protein [uncultured Bacteroides sp.]|uniref:DUF4858 domain-containing protein n=1 Tax=uncultured Bacteroides sp. TaxID=162156 RepID=UPI0026011749|nr:DUF4858 domain-containing protein [uncultured Bacteroides sp.]
MRTYSTIIGLLFAAVLPLCAQDWTPQDSLRLRRLLDGEGELKLNPKALKELEQEPYMGKLRMSEEKQWMDFNTTLPEIPEVPKKKVVLTLRPYNARTKYNWDPVYQKKINIDKNTWRGNPFHELVTRKTYTNWAKRPLDKGMRKSLEEIEATGLRYRVTERANNMAVGSWQSAGGGAGIGGLDLMTPFTKEFWDFKGRKRRARTLEVLREYGDSITVQMQRTSQGE